MLWVSRDHLTLLLCLFLFMLTTCGKDSPTKPKPSEPTPPAVPVATRIVITPPSATLNAVGRTVQLSARVLDQNGTAISGATTTWNSGNPSVASVNNQGLVTALKNGFTDIVARTGNISATARISVSQVTSRIAIEPAMATLMSIGATVQLIATVFDGNDQPVDGAVVTWQSSDETVATVDDAGLVTALSNGVSRISARIGSVSQSAEVRVMQEAKRIAIEPAMATLMSIGATVQLTATVFDGNDQPVDGAVVTWQSSDETVATVSMQGLVTAVDNGIAKITATSGGASAEIEVNVLVPSPDREVLIAVYNNMGGPEWKNSTNWLSNTHVEDWYGVQTNEDGRVTALNLGHNGLNGLIPIEIARLIELRGLSLEDNQLTGPILPELGQLSNLTHVYLYDNQLSGSIPSELGQLVNLIHLCLNGNRLAGPIPPELSRLSNLKWLHLHNNQELSGALPVELTSLNLDALLLQGTKVCVPSDPSLEEWISKIPDARIARCDGIDLERDALIAFYNATNGENWNDNTNWLSDDPLENWAGVQTDAAGKVTVLRLYSNALSGSIPPELGHLSSLVWLDLSYNQLSGSIPPELGQLSNLEDLHFASNLLTGNIPAELGQPKKMAEMRLAGNRLTGNIPSELGQLTRLTHLSLDRNILSGSIPAELGQLINLKRASFSKNQLTGSLPSELGQMANLTVLNLFGNNLTGAIPIELGQMTNLEDLDLAVNELSNEIPSELSQLKNLRRLNLAGNRLTGSIPAELGQMSSLTLLFLAQNLLTGSIPAELGQMSSLTGLYLSQNLLTGSIPAELGQLTNLRNLSLYKNQLTGHIPSTLGNLADVRALDLLSNNLSGNIPAELGQLENLRVVILVDNPSLAGSLSRELMSLALRILHLEGTKLCVPGDAEFQSWYNGIPHRNGGKNCDEFVDTQERTYLAELHDATDGLNWIANDNWLSGIPVGQWFGVTTNPSGRVEQLILENNNLNGTLPGGIDRLADLKTLHLGGNPSLNGILPREILNLSIESLKLDGSPLCAPIDAEYQTWLTSVSEKSGVQNCEETVAVNDRSVLIDFFHATDGPNWSDNSNWLSDRPLGEWYGVTSNSEGRVTELRLWNDNLSGPLTPGLNQLDHLTRLSLVGNRLNGGIPAELGQLGGLVHLNLTNNQLSGGIPSELGELDELLNLSLTGNRLTGGIPGGLSQSKKLSYLGLSYNQLSGDIPAELGQLANLTSLVLSGNHLSGAIPAELGHLTSLDGLYLGSNRLSGVIPSELGQLPKLRVLDLSINQLSGPIPARLRNLSNLTRLSLSSNQLSGNLPVELGELTNLNYAYLGGNRLSGSLPSELGNLTSLKILALDGNAELTGPVPLSLLGIDFEQFTFYGTQLCTPGGTEFQTWFQQIENRSNVGECRISMNPEVYLTQAVQSFAFPVPLVDGEPALLRVFFATDDLVWNRPSVSAGFYHDGTEVHTVDIPGGPSKIPVQIDEGSLETSANAVVPANVISPGLEMVVEIAPVGMPDTESGIAMRIPETGRMAIDVRSVPPLNLTLVPLLWMDNPDYSIVTTTEQLTEEDELFRSTRDLLPVREFSVNVRDAFFTSVNPVNFEDEQLFSEVAMLRTSDGSTSHYMGVIPEGGFGGIADTPGFVSLAILDEYVIAHELGHNMSLLHAPCGVDDGDITYPHDNGAIGAWGYNLSNGSLIPPETPDLMGRCRPNWISDYYLQKAINYRVMEESRLTATSMSAMRSMLVWGRVNGSGDIVLEPSFVIETRPSLPHESGPYRMEGEDSDGNTLFTLNFAVSEIPDVEGGAFAFAIPVQADWAYRLTRVTLSGPGGFAELTRDGNRSAAFLLDRNTRKVRGVLRDWPGPTNSLQAARRVLPEPGLEVIISSGIPDPADWAP